MVLTMGNDRSLPLLRGLSGGVLAGLGLCLSGPWWMVPALALLWSVVRSPLAAALWAAVAVAISHRWLLALHPLTWLGVPAPLSFPLALMVWLACSLSAALLVAGWSLLARWLPGRCGLPQALVLSLAWGLSETLLARGPLFWIGVGGSVLPADRWLAGLAGWIGAGGLAAVQLLLGWWLWQFWSAVRAEAEQRWRLFRWGVLALLVIHGLGVVALTGFAQGMKDDQAALSMALWQTAIPTREKFSVRRQTELPRRLHQAMESAQRGGAQLLIAPEGTLPVKLGIEPDGGIPLISGGFRFVAGQQRSSLLLMTPEASGMSNSIDKHRLVPLGEWAPSLPGLAGLSAVGGLQSGEPSRLWRWGGPPVAVAICYEISNGTAIAEAVAGGAQWILAAANLDPYPLLLQRQFLALAQLRSLETARPLVSVANTGPTALIADRGLVKSQLPAMVPGLLPVGLEPLQGMTLYAVWREWPLWLMLLIAAGFLLKARSGSAPLPARTRLRKTPPPGQG
tara:strand:- start:2782 stop:4311 length:1530 start_codon:yes stop_codon:yes gene_type:complete